MDIPRFDFRACYEITELLGAQATDEKQLLEKIEDVPTDSIYYHTHSYFLRHYYITGPYSNDFANWTLIQVRDRILGEKLSSVMPTNDKSIEDIRLELIDIIDEHLSTTKVIPFVVYGQPFHFMKSTIIEIPTEHSVSTLEEFIEALRVVDASAIYNHIFEARHRIRRGKSDFSIWLEEALGLDSLAEAIENIDSYMYSLESLREKILSLCESEVDHDK